MLAERCISWQHWQLSFWPPQEGPSDPETNGSDQSVLPLAAPQWLHPKPNGERAVHAVSQWRHETRWHAMAQFTSRNPASLSGESHISATQHIRKVKVTMRLDLLSYGLQLGCSFSKPKWLWDCERRFCCFFTFLFFPFWSFPNADSSLGWEESIYFKLFLFIVSAARTSLLKDCLRM